ncbi:hypothetical protein D3C73_1286460 [compost metagenome]
MRNVYGVSDVGTTTAWLRAPAPGVMVRTRVVPSNTSSRYASIASPLLSGGIQFTCICAWFPTGASSWVVGAAGCSGGPAGTSDADHPLQLDGSGARLCAWTRTW